MAHTGGAGRRLAAAGAVVLLAFGLWWVGGVAYANCPNPSDPMCPPATSPPQTSPPQTSPPATQAPSHTYSTSVTNSPHNTPTENPQPRVVTRTPPRENFTPRRQPTFQPSVPATPTEEFQPAADPTPLPEAQVGAVPIATPEPQPAPPPPPPPAAKSDGPGTLPLGLAGGLGVAGGAALAWKKYEDEMDSTLTSGVAKLGGGLAIVTAVGIGITTGAVAIGTTAVVGPVLFAVGWGLAALGAIDLMSLPKVEPTGPAAHAGSVRG